MESVDSRSATLSPLPEAASSPSLVEPLSSPLKRKSTTSVKAKTLSTRSSHKRISRAKASETDIKSEATAAAILPAMTPPTTPAHPQPPTPAMAASTSKGALLADESKNQLSINRFRGITPVLRALNKGPVNLGFEGAQDPDVFVITGLLYSHDMTIVKEGTEIKDQLQSKSTLTLFFVDAETFATCVGDQLNAIDTWIRTHRNFQLASDKIFRSPFDEFGYTVDLTWPQYERISNSRGGRERKDGFAMRRKPQLDPESLEDEHLKLSWDDIQQNSLLRAVVSISAYRDERNNLNRAYARWTLTVSSVLMVRGPIGDLEASELPSTSETALPELLATTRSCLRF